MEKCIEEEEESGKCSSQQSVLHNLQSLKIKSNRGRPRKPSLNKENKFFKVPKHRKKRGNSEAKGLIREYNFNMDEAKAIYDTGTCMGLLPVHEEAQSLLLIREHLEL